MTLSEFIKKRLEELGHNRSWLVNHGDLDWSTLSNIDRGLSIRKVTQEKLAKALHCSQGDIQKCMAEAPNPLRKEAAKPEGQAGISITAKAKTVKKVTPTPNPKDEEVAPEKVPIKWHEDKMVEEDMIVPNEIPRPGLTKTPSDVNVEMYKAHLREMLVKRMAEIRMSASVADVYAEFGRMIAQELI